MGKKRILVPNSPPAEKILKTSEDRKTCFWILKTEPHEYAHENLRDDKTTMWGGIRNYRARNFQRDMRPGDKLLMYHTVSGTKNDPNHPPNAKTVYLGSGKREVVGTALVLEEAIPEPRKPSDTKDGWLQLKIGYDTHFKRAVGLDELKTLAELDDFLMFRQPRLSVIPLSENQFSKIVQLGNSLES